MRSLLGCTLFLVAAAFDDVSMIQIHGQTSQQEAIDVWIDQLADKLQDPRLNLLAVSTAVKDEPAAGGGGDYTNDQYMKMFIKNAIPQFGFGVIDNGIMVTAGTAIDGFITEKFGIGGMYAAGFGNAVSDAVGVLVGDTIEGVAENILPPSGIPKDAQNEGKPFQVKAASGVFGIVLGCFVGLTPLLVLGDEGEEEESPANPALVEQLRQNVPVMEDKVLQTKVLEQLAQIIEGFDDIAASSKQIQTLRNSPEGQAVLKGVHDEARRLTEQLNLQ